ncbi:MAG: FRG domain-containing protein [Gammaproteobacteria bacterium]|nr:MAG: FRG domain-containing protein [Gammaproteobacteria bacterium]
MDRQLRGKSGKKAKALNHLDRFKQSVRGRRGPSPAKLDNDNEWWALGQHHGLATPLLDWTESPFAALYFAFEKPTRPPGGKRCVWALGSVTKKNSEIQKTHDLSEFVPILEYIRPLQDENARLVAQAGLFTRAPLGESVDSWVKKSYAGEKSGATLIKIMIPERGRTECLRTLNTMNINHLSLFPDIYGASLHCNKSLQIDKY